MANLGFIGLGTMGGKMVRRLLNAGHTVTGYNRTKSRGDWLVDLGMLWGDTPRAVAEIADVTFTMVANTQALEAVTGGPDGVLAALGPEQGVYRHEHCQPRRKPFICRCRSRSEARRCWTPRCRAARLPWTPASCR